MNQPPAPEIPPELRDPPAAPPAPQPRSAAGMTRKEIFEGASSYAAAFGFIGTVLAAAGLGWLVDWKFGTGPWGVLVGLMLGFAGSTIKLVRDANKPPPP